MNRKDARVYEYLRHEKKFPGVWCSGCGIGIVMGALVRAIDDIGLDKNQVAVVSGIGCTGRMPVYLDFNTMHTTHGRASENLFPQKLSQRAPHGFVRRTDGINPSDPFRTKTLQRGGCDAAFSYTGFLRSFP